MVMFRKLVSCIGVFMAAPFVLAVIVLVGLFLVLCVVFFVLLVILAVPATLLLYPCFKIVTITGLDGFAKALKKIDESEKADDKEGGDKRGTAE